jgi:hypothetical protein
VVLFKAISQHLPQRVKKYEKSFRFYYFRFENSKISIIRHIVVDQIPKPGLNMREYFKETVDGKTWRYIRMYFDGFSTVHHGIE